MNAKIIISVLTGLGLLAACKKQQQSTPIPVGSYSGRFIYDNTLALVPNHHESKVTVTFDGVNYTSSGGANRYPAGGSGSYTTGNNQITFNDINVWTADFDWGLILSGNYNYHYEGDTVVITKPNDWKITYQYRLKKN